MPRSSTIAHDAVQRTLSAQEVPVFRRSDLKRLLEHHRSEWRLGNRRLERFLRLLEEHHALTTVEVPLPHRKETRYVLGRVSSYALALSLKPGAYLSHYSAVHLHGLTDQVPETIYVNSEQRPQPRPETAPTQQSIDRAFAGKQRVTTNIAPLGDGSGRRVCVINGKNTGKLGVIEASDEDGRPLRVTDVERTLIDATVRPYYAGGVSEVLEAYRRAADRVSLNRLSATLKKLDYVYPYNQAVGFYLSRAGYDQERVRRLFLPKVPELKFYLTYGMAKKEYSAEWGVYHPTGL